MHEERNPKKPKKKQAHKKSNQLTQSKKSHPPQSEPMTSWGALVNDGAQAMEVAPWALVFPAVFLATTLFCFNFIGDGLRDALDPRLRRART